MRPRNLLALRCRALEKIERHELILELVRSAPIGSQDELGEKLSAKGFRATQATLSRDLRELGVVKTALADGGFRYTTLEQRQTSPVKNVQISGNILVVHTESGMAAPVAYKIDDLGIEGVLGTVAGEDTLIAILADKASPKKIKADIEDKLRSL